MNDLSSPVRCRLTWAFMAIGSLILPHTVHAHDEHDNLPSTGVAVRGDRLLISPEAQKSLGVSTTVLHLQDLKRDVMANATVEIPWRTHAFATSLVAGRIAEVLVQPGDTVDKGQRLAEVESQEIETLQLDLLKAASEYLLASRLLEQRGGLASSGSISERRVLETQTTRDQFAADRGIAIRKLLSLGFTSAMIDQLLTTREPIRTIPIVSPLAGIVSAANVRVGQVVSPWQQVYEIVDLSTVWVHGQVLETDSTSVAEGQPVDVLVDALPDQNFVGKVDHVGVKLDPESRSLHVHVEVDNHEKLLREGMFCRLRIRARVAADAIACPYDAVVDPGGSPWLLIEDRPGTYLRQPVKLGMRSGSFVEILDGAFPGDPVVITGKHELASLFTAADEQQASGASATTSPGSHSAQHSPAPPQVIAQGQIELPTDKKATAYSTVTGRIARVLVEHGQSVKAGEVLAEVESLELRNVQLDLLRAQSQLKLSRKVLEQYRRLNATGGIAEKDLWETQSETDNLQATVNSLRHKLSLMGLADEEIEQIAGLDIAQVTSSEPFRTISAIRSPIDGRITLFDLSIGQVVRPQDELFEVHDTRRVVARGYVHEHDSVDVGVGQPVTVTITADPTYAAGGVINRTAPTLSTFSRAMSVWAELDNSGGELKEGMLARLAITPRARPDATARGPARQATAPHDTEPHGHPKATPPGKGR
jgi:cobalt-zinc-cadmium efflux system membrane fusion protein